MITPDMARADPASVQFQAANGRILSPERSKAILDRLKPAARRAATSSTRHLALEQARRRQRRSSLGNTVVLLEDGPATYAAMFGAIAAARDHINMETYILEDDEVGQQFADALIAKQRARRAGEPDLRQRRHARHAEGVLQAPDATPASRCSSSTRSIRSSPRAGWDVNQRDHRKLLVVDGRSGVPRRHQHQQRLFERRRSARQQRGGSRGGDKQSLPWRDTDLQIEGPGGRRRCRSSSSRPGSKQKGEPLAPRAVLPAAAARRARRSCARSAARPTSRSARSTRR